MYYLGHTNSAKKKVFIVYLRFKFNWASYILFGNPKLQDLLQVAQIKLRIFALSSPKLRQKALESNV